MKYLFTVLLSNGKYIEQTIDDVSSWAPYKSTYFDVLEEEKNGNKPVIFVLIGDGKDYLVDLRDGHFEVNKASFFLHEVNLDIRDFRLIYYRERKKIFNQFLKEMGDETVFCFGWQATLNGANIQRIMMIR